MAICTMCRQEMRTADSCVAWKVPTARGDVAVVPYGGEERVVDLHDDELGSWGEDDWDAGWAGGSPPGPGGGVAHVWTSERCGDCGVRRGGTHHPGCDVAECPVCHQQLFSCGCWDESVDDRELDARYGSPPPGEELPRV